MTESISKSSKNITFLIGAGASYPFLIKDNEHLSTQVVTKKLFEKERWDVLLRKTKELCNNDINYSFNLTVDIMLELIKDIFLFNYQEVPKELLSFLDSLGVKQEEAKPIYVDNLNFEHILYFLDKVCNSLIEPSYSSDNYLLDFWSDGISNKKNKYRTYKGWSILPYLTREVLIDIILDFWEASDKTESLQLNRAFFDNAVKRFNAVNIYSLNYDPLIYEAVKGLGFYSGISPNGAFNPGVFLETEHIIAFLHGHVGFNYSGRSLKFSENYREAQKNRLIGICSKNLSSGYQNRGAKGIHYNTYFVSGLDKFDAFFDNPFSAYMMRFSKDIIDSDYIVLIGVGFRDGHLNLFLKNKLAISKKAKIIDVNWKSEQDRGNIKMASGYNPDIWEKWGFFENNSISLAMNDSDIDKTFRCIGQAQENLWANRGTAYLTDKMILDFRGTEIFFKETDIEEYLASLLAEQQSLAQKLRNEV